MKNNWNRRTLIAGTGAATLGLFMPAVLRAQEDQITIGTLAPMTGSGAPFGPEIAEAHRMVVEQVNAAGGVGGRRIRLVQEDSETNPEAAIRAARKLVDADGALAIIGTWSSSVTLGIMPLCQEAGVIQMCISAATEIAKADRKRLVYNFQPLSPAWGKAIGELALETGLRSFGVMGLNNDFTTSMIESFVASVESGGGNLNGSPFLYNGGQTSYRAEVEKLIAGAPEAVFIPSYVTDFTAVYRELYQAGYEGRVLTISVSTGPQFKSAVGQAAEGILHGFPVPPVDSDTYNAYLRFVGKEPNGQVQNPMGCAAYDQINTLLLAIASAESDAEIAPRIHEVANGPGTKIGTVLEGLELLARNEPVEYVGASSDVRFQEGSGVLESRDFMLYEIRNGEDVPLRMMKVQS